MRQRRQQNKDDVAGHLRLHQARRAVRERILQHGHHCQAGNEKGRVLHPGINLNVSAQGVREYEQIEQGGQNRREYGLHAHFPEAQPLLVEQCVETGHCARIALTRTCGTEKRANEAFGAPFKSVA
jgi:hypothetical protein